MPIGHVAPLLALAAGAIATLLVVIAVGRRHQGLGALVAMGGLVAAGLATVHLARTLPPQTTFHGTWAHDGVTGWTTGAIVVATALVVALSPGWFRDDPRHGEWYAVLLLSALGAAVLAGAADTQELVLGMLLASVTGSVLASYHRASRMSAEAGAKFFLLGALTNPLLFLGVVLLYGLCATTTYAGTAAALAGGADPVALTAATALVLVGVGFELGAVPAHPWVPDVAQGSPGPAAAFLTVVPKVGALVAIARFVQLLPDEQVAWRPLVAALAAATMTVGNLAAMWQDDVRRLLGWSSVGQAGYGLMAVVALGRSELAVPSLVMFVVGYGAANLAAFAVVVALRGRTRLRDYRGLARSRPWHATVLVLALLSLIGVPPLVGFAAKLALFAAAIDAGYGWLALLAVAATVVSVFYYLRVIAAMVVEPSRGPRPALLGAGATAVALVAGGLVVAIGLAAELVLAAARGVRLLPG